jgi:hypothetical protein
LEQRKRRLRGNSRRFFLKRALRPALVFGGNRGLFYGAMTAAVCNGVLLTGDLSGAVRSMSAAMAVAQKRGGIVMDDLVFIDPCVWCVCYRIDGSIGDVCRKIYYFLHLAQKKVILVLNPEQRGNIV